MPTATAPQSCALCGCPITTERPGALGRSGLTWHTSRTTCIAALADLVHEHITPGKTRVKEKV
jgi:hypothetical protein